MLTDLQSGAPESTVPEVRSAAEAGSANDPQASAELRSLTGGCGVYALDGRTKLAITGEDRTRWLNGMITNNIRDLAAGHGVYAFLLNPQGRIQGDLYAFNRGSQITLDVEREQAAKLLEIFDHYIVMDDVAIEDAGDRLAAVGVQGPKAPTVLKASGIEVPTLGHLQLTDVTWRSLAVTLVRAEAWKGEAYELWLEPRHSADLLEALRQAGASPAGVGAQRLFRIASGIPQFGEDIRERDLPQETGQERALHFAKGCYVGQEIVERIRSRGQVHRVFSGFSLSAPVVPGDKVEADGKDVGEITGTASLTTSGGEQRIALGYLRREAFSKTLTVQGSPVRRHELPFQELLAI